MPANNADISVIHVDDEPDFVDMAAEFIERQDERITVEAASSASEGFHRLSENSIDCIVSDYDMPEQNGIEFLRAVREDYPELPFILYTGKGSEEVASEAISAGVTDYLQKGSGTSQYEVLANRIVNVVSQLRAREEAAETEQRLRTIAENTNDVLWKFSADWEELLFINSPYEEIWGGSIDELRKRPTSFLEKVHPDDRAKTRDAMERLSNGESIDYQHRVNPDDDFGRWVWVQGEPVFDEDGEVERVVGFARDITERKQRELELKRSEERYRRLLETSPHPVLIKDQRAEILFVNASAREFLGASTREEVIGRKVGEFIVPEDRAEVEDRRRKLLELGEEVPPKELTIVDLGGQEKHAIVSSALVTFEGQSGIQTVATDITERKERDRELRNAYAQIENAVEAGAISTWEWHIQEDLLVTDRAFANTFGVNPEQAQRGVELNRFIARVHDDDRERVEELIEQSLAECGDYEAEYRVRNADDELRWVLARGHVECNEDGTPVTFPGVLVDITERKRQAERFNALFQNSGDAIVFTEFVDDVPIVRNVNPSFEDSFGCGKEEAIGRPVDEVVVPDDPEKQREAEAINRRIQSGERVVAEIRRQTPDGVRDFLLQSTPLLPDETNEFTYAIYTDITQRKSYERALEGLHDASERLLQADSKDEACQAVIDIAEGVLEHPYGSVFLWDDATAKLEAIANSDQALTVFGEPPSFERGEGIIGHVFQTGQRLVLDDAQENPQALDSGSDSIRAYAVFPLGDYGVLVFGSPEVGAMAGQELQLAENLARHTRVALDQIDRQNTLLEREEVLERQNGRLDEFASVVSHDLRNPLSVARGRLELALEECESEHVDAVERAHDRMEELIDDLLSLARAGEEFVETGPLELADVTEASWRQVATGDANLSVKTDATIEADESRVKQLLENLLRNAVEHSEPGVAITIGDLPDGFYVEDDGPGMPEDQRENVLQPGYTTSETGSGFGLSIVRDIAEAHGWTINLTSGSTGGARFEFTGVLTT